MLTNMLALIGFLFATAAAVDLSAFSNSAQYFPDEIPVYEVRKDSYTNEPVSRGRMHLINYKLSERMIPLHDEKQKEKMVKYADFHRHLQCASPEPEMDGNRGSWSMVKMAPPTRESIEMIAAWAETKCEPWVKCREHAQQFKSGAYNKGFDDLDRVWGMFRGAVLLRIIDNEAYYDWPWGIERFKSREDHYSNLLTDHMALLEMVIRTVSDIGDSVFFFGGERAFIKWNVPFPTFSFAPQYLYGDYPFPWLESYNLESHYEAEAEVHKNFSDEFFKRDQQPWEKRIPKAGFFASFQQYRQLIYDSAALRPDLFDVSYSPNNPMKPWNPLSDEPEENGQHPAADVPERAHTGFLQPIHKFNDGRHYQPHSYKYVVVPVGSDAQSSSGRLAGLLAHSGAVVLLQASSFSYHFSARLVPWVHYVPLSFSMADVIDKVQWLHDHDAQARQIVKNAENFARSYLRIEDYFCYVAGALKLISQVENTTDALQGFSPRLIHRIA